MNHRGLFCLLTMFMGAASFAQAIEAMQTVQDEKHQSRRRPFSEMYVGSDDDEASLYSADSDSDSDPDFDPKNDVPTPKKKRQKCLAVNASNTPRTPVHSYVPATSLSQGIQYVPDPMSSPFGRFMKGGDDPRARRLHMLMLAMEAVSDYRGQQQLIQGTGFFVPYDAVAKAGLLLLYQHGLTDGNDMGTWQEFFGHPFLRDINFSGDADILISRRGLWLKKWVSDESHKKWSNILGLPQNVKEYTAHLKNWTGLCNALKEDGVCLQQTFVNAAHRGGWSVVQLQTMAPMLGHYVPQEMPLPHAVAAAMQKSAPVRSTPVRSLPAGRKKHSRAQKKRKAKPNNVKALGRGVPTRVPLVPPAPLLAGQLVIQTPVTQGVALEQQMLSPPPTPKALMCHQALERMRQELFEDDDTF